MVGHPFLLHIEDLMKILALWMRYTVDARDDPDVGRWGGQVGPFWKVCGLCCELRAANFPRPGTLVLLVSDGLLMAC